MVAGGLFLMQGKVPGLGRQADGAALYGQMCALCHGPNGEGYAAPASPALANPQFLAIADDAYLFENIARGRPGTRMSAWSDRYGGPLTDGQVKAIVGFIREWQTVPAIELKNMVVQGEASHGTSIYQATCAVCHGEAGAGRLDAIPEAPDGVPSLNNPVFLETASDGYIRYSIAHGRPGTPMKAYAGELTDREIDDLVAFIRSWQ